MSESEIRTKKAAIRQEIKDRMQRELDGRKAEIRERIRQESIPVEEKRKKYRQNVHEEKLRLMALAKEEFRARKRMLGIATEPEHEEISSGEPPPVSLPREEMLPEEQEPASQASPSAVAPEEAFIHDDDAGSSVREYEAPISASDALPLDAKQPHTEAPAGLEEEFEEEAGIENLLHYIINLIFHPFETLDALAEYVSSPKGIRNIALFYLASLLPIVVLTALFAGPMSEHAPHGIMSRIIGSSFGEQPGPVTAVGFTLFNLLLYTFSVSMVNYLVAGKTGFVPLLVYFSFIEAVIRVLLFTLAIAAVFAAVIAPPLLAAVAMFFISFLLWTLALNIIVLMSTYEYGLIEAFLLAIGAWVARLIVIHAVLPRLGLTLS